MWNIQREGCHALEEIMRMIIRTKERQCTKQSPNEPMDNGGLYWVDTMSALRETYRTIRALLMANSSYGKEISTHIENPTRAGGKTVNEWLINDTGKAMPW
jgi:hypothetical protein